MIPQGYCFLSDRQYQSWLSALKYKQQIYLVWVELQSALPHPDPNNIQIVTEDFHRIASLF